jgi:hypothetical protein
MTKENGHAKTGELLSLLKITEIIDDPELSAADKRAVLASWISDARAIDNLPHLRRLDDGVIVSVDEILLALKSLDHEDRRAFAA